jgi:hypothetical protein
MVFEKLPVIESKDLHVGCLNCSTAAIVAPMDMLIAVGFGSATVTKDGELVYDEMSISGENYWTVQDAENLAIKEPDCDWRINKEGPLHGETFQRQGDNNWVCVESNRGFA